MSAFKYETQQRLYVEPGAMSNGFFDETRQVEDQDFDETDFQDGKMSVLKQGCGRCGKNTHETNEFFVHIHWWDSGMSPTLLVYLQLGLLFPLSLL